MDIPNGNHSNIILALGKSECVDERMSAGNAAGGLRSQWVVMLSRAAQRSGDNGVQGPESQARHQRVEQRDCPGELGAPKAALKAAGGLFQGQCSSVRQLFIMLGNDRANEFWAATLSPGDQLDSDASPEQRKDFIARKYREGRYRLRSPAFSNHEELLKVRLSD